MKLIYVIKQDMDPTLQAILETQKKQHEVEIIDLGEEIDYDLVIDKIASCDKVISW